MSWIADLIIVVYVRVHRMCFNPVKLPAGILSMKTQKIDIMEDSIVKNLHFGSGNVK
jgi:hypothetical protein